MTSLPSFRELERRLRQLLRLRGQSREDIDDVIQDAFLRLELYSRRGGEVVEPEAFLVRTALRLSSNVKRSLRRRSRFEVACADMPQVMFSASPEDALAAEQSLGRINESLSEVPESTRDVFLLHRLEGYTYSQIAELYGMTNKAVERRIARAMVAVYRANKEAMEPERTSI